MLPLQVELSEVLKFFNHKDNHKWLNSTPNSHFLGLISLSFQRPTSEAKCNKHIIFP